MKVGIPSEVKNNEFRVAITPAGVNELRLHDHEVYVQRDAGLGFLHHQRGVRARRGDDPRHRRRGVGHR